MVNFGIGLVDVFLMVFKLLFVIIRAFPDEESGPGYPLQVLIR